MPPMQARPRPVAPPRWPSRLVLWLAAGLFVFQVALHASMPTGTNMNMAEWLEQLVTGQVSTGQVSAGQVGMGQADMGQMDMGPLETGHPDGSGTPSGHAHHAEGLCCMPPAALLPAFWTPPPLPLGRQTLVPAKAVHEALRIMRATARGPPRARAAGVQAV